MTITKTNAILTLPILTEISDLNEPSLNGSFLPFYLYLYISLRTSFQTRCSQNTQFRQSTPMFQTQPASHHIHPVQLRHNANRSPGFSNRQGYNFHLQSSLPFCIMSTIEKSKSPFANYFKWKKPFYHHRSCHRCSNLDTKY